jgi:hypothetical protein
LSQETHLQTVTFLSIQHLVCRLVLKMQRATLLRRIQYISLLGNKAVLQRKLFTSEGSGKGNGVPCSTTDDKALDEVMKLKDFNAVDRCEYIE